MSDFLEGKPVTLDLTPGKLYWYRPIGEKGERRQVGPYEVVGTGYDVRVRDQHKVVYRSTAAPKGSVLLIASLEDFARLFEPCDERKPDAPVSQDTPTPPEKAAGYVPTSIHG